MAMKKTNYFVMQRNELKNMIKDLMKTDATDLQIISVISEEYGYKHTTIQTLIEECRVEINGR